MTKGDPTTLADRQAAQRELLRNALERFPRPEVSPHEVPKPVITVSREFGAGGHTVARMLLHRLDGEWQVWDSNIVDAIAQKAEVLPAVVEDLDQHVRGPILDVFGHLIGSPLNPQEYGRLLREVLRALAERGKVIIVGRGANFVLQKALNVRLIAGKEHRIAYAMNELGLSRLDAMDRVRKEDEERAKWVHNMFERDIADPMAYDMVLRTDTLGMETAADLIAVAAARMFRLRLR